jgi:hypothetical protein
MKAWAVPLWLVVLAQPTHAQPSSPRAVAPQDFAGYWVSVVTEDWRFRMVTPPKGDTAGVPLNAAGLKVANAWDPATDAAGDPCRPYGAAAIMRMPGRVHITWQDDETLRIDVDAGTQTRLLHFREPRTTRGGPTRQGRSIASWYVIAPPPGGNFQLDSRPLVPGPPRPGLGGTLKVVTTGMQPGYLRRNGVPYSERAVVTEYFSRHSAYGEWFTVTTIVDDPTFLFQPFVTSTHFRKEPDGSRWTPAPCEPSTPLKETR